MQPGSVDPAIVHAALTSVSTVTTTTSAPIFLLPNGTFIVELVLFIIVLGVVARFILAPIKAAMDGRAATIRGAQQASDQDKSEAERLVAERHEVLDAARAEARALLEEAANRAEELFQEGRSAGQGEHDDLLAASQPRIDAEGRTLEHELMGKMRELVVAAAGGVVGEPVDIVKHRQVIDAALERAASSTGDGA